MNEAQALTLEAGKYYRTRGGKKVFVAALSLFDDQADHPVAVIIGNEDVEGELQWYAPSGKYNAYHGGDLEEDLVAEWVEPKRIKGWLNIYGMPHSKLGSLPKADAYAGTSLHPSREIADTASLNGFQFQGLRIACIEIDVLEGHGLNGEAA